MTAGTLSVRYVVRRAQAKSEMYINCVSGGMGHGVKVVAEERTWSAFAVEIGLQHIISCWKHTHLPSDLQPQQSGHLVNRELIAQQHAVTTLSSPTSTSVRSRWGAGVATSPLPGTEY